MEHVESALGVYSSTGGFLSLLKSLFKSGVYPSNLGSNWRLRAGCTPYIEYIIHLILPRLTGKFMNLPALPFRTPQDRLLIITLAFEAVEAALARYCVLPPIPIPVADQAQARNTYSECLSIAEKELGLRSLAEDVVIEPFSEEEKNLSYADFAFLRDIERQSLISNSNDGRLLQSVTSGSSFSDAAADRSTRGVPPAKSPGLTVLMSILSSTDAVLFNSITGVARGLGGPSSECVATDRLALAYSLYVATPPSFSLAKEAFGNTSSPFSAHIIVEAIQPKSNAPTSEKALELKERLSLSILRLLCAVLVREPAIMALVAVAPSQSSLVPILRFQTSFQVASQLKVFDFQLSRLAQQIHTADLSYSIVSDLIDCACFQGVDEKRSVRIASAATSIVFYLERSLGPRRGFDLLCRDRDGRSFRLARTFGCQLVACAGLQHLTSSSELVRLTVERLLADLRNGDVFGDSMVYTLFGLAAKAVHDIHGKDVHWSQKPQNCVDAILRLVQNAGGEFFDENSHLGAMCYEVLFRLCRLFNLDTVHAFRVAIVSERLRKMRFWTMHLEKMISRVGKAQNQGSKHAMDLIHSLAWILKGVAEELYLLSGSVHKSELFQYPTFFQRQPTQYEKLLEALFKNDHDFMRPIVSLIPMEQLTFDVKPAVPSAEAIRLSKCSLMGSPEVVEGYFCVDKTRLCSLAKSYSKLVDEDALVMWSDQWNQTVTRDCAASHLSNAIRIVVGVATMGILELSSHIPVEYRMWMKILECFLRRMEDNYSLHARGRSLDRMFYTTPTRNLGLAILMVSEVVLSCSNADKATIFDVCVMISNLITFSYDEFVEGPGADRKSDRTATFATALCLLLQSLSTRHVQPLEYDKFLGSAIVLSQLATDIRHDTFPFVPQTEALICRSVLALLLQLFPGESAGVDRPEVESLCRSVMTASSGRYSTVLIADNIIGLLPLLDGDIPSLLLTIAGLPGMSQLLLARGILDAMRAAAERYVQEEAAFLSTTARSMEYLAADIAIPSFFPGHMKLLCTLVMARGGGSLRSSDISNILLIYSPLINRLITRFPVDGDVLELVVKCIALVHVASSEESGRLTQSLIVKPLAAKESLALETKIAVLTIHIVENPIPSKYQRALPHLLDPKAGDARSSAVSTSNNVVKSWWDGMRTLTTENKDSNDELCRVAIRGLTMVRSGLLMIRRTDSIFNSIDVMHLLRAVCRCVDAAKVRYHTRVFLLP